MDRFIRVLGPLGLLLIVVGGVIYGIMHASGWLSILPLLAGLTFSITALIYGYRAIRTEGGKRTARIGINTGLTIIVSLAILIFVQTLSTRHRIRFDTTANRRFSLSPQTVKVLRSTGSVVEVTCFFKESDPRRTEIFDLLSEFRNITPKIDFKFIDPVRDPINARKYDIEKDGVVLVQGLDRRERLEDLTEAKLTNAIHRVLSSGAKTIYFLTGHGEKSIGDGEPSGFSSLVDALRQENFDVREFLALGSERIPSDCDILVIAGPREDILKLEQNLIFDYIMSGGKLLFMVDPVADLPLLTAVASVFGIAVRDDIIIDPNGQTLAGNYLTPVVNRYGTHPITDDFRLFSFFPQSRSIDAAKKIPDAVTVTILGKTDSRAYSESNVDTLIAVGKTQFEGDKDIPGPVPLAVCAEMELVSSRPDSTSSGTNGFSRIVVFGDSDFAGNVNIRLSGNRDLALNTFNWLAEEEDLISVRPADTLNQPVLLSTTQGGVVFWIPVIGLPAMVALTGLMVNIRKKRS